MKKNEQTIPQAEEESKGIAEIVFTLLLGTIGITGAFIGFIVLHTVIEGFVVMKLWNWLIYPVFPSLGVIRLVHGMAIAVFVGILTSKPQRKIEDKEECIKLLLTHMFLNPLMYLAVGFALSLFYR